MFVVDHLVTKQPYQLGVIQHLKVRGGRAATFFSLVSDEVVVAFTFFPFFFFLSLLTRQFINNVIFQQDYR